MKRLAVSLVVLLCSFSVAHAGEIIKGCYHKNNGQLRILIGNATCRPDELPISIATGGIAPRLDPELYDAKGQYLGIPMGSSFYIPSLNKFAILDAGDGDHDADIYPGELFYASEDCTGTPYMIPEWYPALGGNSGALSHQFVEFVRGKYYLPGEPLTESVALYSVWRGQYPEYGCGPFTDTAFAGFPAVEVTLPFTTPVALPLDLRPTSAPSKMPKR
jgi:hypothetical protein